MVDFPDEVFSEDYLDLDCRSIVISEKQFFECSFTNCNFAGSQFINCRFVDCSFENCDLSNAKIRGAAFRDVRFSKSKLIGMNWPEAASISHLEFENCVLNYANFVGIDLRKSVMKECTTKDAEFSQANLSDTNCQGTDFAGSRFGNTNLSKADFRKAINYSIRPGENNLKKAKFSLPEATMLLYGLDIVLED
jgi:fluoroquinolone resistance protein